jgi:thioesterase domain-containing protein
LRTSRELRELQPAGPYQLLGYSGGGSIAFEIARQLELAGERVALLGINDHAPYALGYALRLVTNLWRRLPFAVEVGLRLGARRILPILRARVGLTAATWHHSSSAEAPEHWDVVPRQFADASGRAHTAPGSEGGRSVASG